LLESQRVTILQALNAAGWVIGGPRGAAARLGLKRTTLITKMRKFGISKPAILDGIARVPETSQAPHTFQFAAD
jgi:DNA-binding NtrC family response regulator